MSSGRPKASSRETIAEAACELFLEQGYEHTSVVDIATRAGVGRSSFFNYFDSKSAVLWAGLDERIAAFEERLAARDAGDVQAVRDEAMALADGFAPDALALGIVHAAAMGIEAEYERDAALRRARIGRAVSRWLSRGGTDRVHAEVAGAAWGGAVLVAIEAWAHAGAGRDPLTEHLARAAEVAGTVPTAAGRRPPLA